MRESRRRYRKPHLYSLSCSEGAITLDEYRAALRFRRSAEIAFGSLLRPDLEPDDWRRPPARQGRQSAARLGHKLDTINGGRRRLWPPADRLRRLRGRAADQCIAELPSTRSVCPAMNSLSCDAKKASAPTMQSATGAAYARGLRTPLANRSRVLRAATAAGSLDCVEKVGRRALMAADEIMIRWRHQVRIKISCQQF